MMQAFESVADYIRSLPKTRRFMVFVALASIVGALVSLLTWVTVYRSPSAPPVTVAIVAPLTGPNATVGEALHDGAQLLAQHRRARPDRQPVQFKLFDSQSPNALRQAAEDPTIVAIVGPSALSTSDASIVAERRVPHIALSGEAGTRSGWTYAISADAAFEARFLANYERNVIGEKLVSVILPEGPQWAAVADAFDETLQRFGTRVVFRWQAPLTGPARKTQLEGIAREISDKLVAGSLLVLGPPEFSAQAVAALSGGRVTNRIIGLRDLGSNGFQTALESMWTGEGSIAAAKNAILFTTPMLFDVAGIGAQTFQDSFKSSYRRSPDWASALGYDAVGLIGSALDMPGFSGKSPRDQRDAIQKSLLGRTTTETAFAGLSAPVFFTNRSGSSLPTVIGRYDGRNIVAAETQLTPIREEGVTNFIQQIQDGKVLYVNDRFMYRTNVVSAGIRLNKVGEPNLEANTVELDFNLWFRWRGKFEVNDVIFENAVEPIKLGAPERSSVDGEERYSSWRVRGKFLMNVANVSRPFGSQLVTVSLRHRTLARNNLMYVGDVVGMDLADGAQVAPEATTWLGRLLGVNSDNRSALLRQLQESRVMAGAPGFTVDNAIMAQDISRVGTDGDPGFVGFGKPAPMFSRVAMHLQVKRDAIDLRGLLPQSVMVYLGIFALSGSILAWLLDRRDRGQFWRMQTMVLRIVSWPVLLAAISALALDYLSTNAALSVVEMVDFAGKCLWWLVPARLCGLAVERFVWAPLETRTGRKVPTVFRMIVSLLIYTVAAFGIVSFVLNKPITSLLATSGLITLIFGLALQSNLKDIFSGVMLNLERPFVLNDWVRINKTFAQVHDISWRTTRLRTGNGQIIAMANGKVVDAEIENLTRAGFYELNMDVYMDPNEAPGRVIDALNRAVQTVKETMEFDLFRISLRGVESVNGNWAARYLIEIRTPVQGSRVPIAVKVWPAVWQELAQAKLKWASVPQEAAV